MAKQSVSKRYAVSANGMLEIKDGRLYISIEDGPQDLAINTLIEDFNGKPVKIAISYDEDYLSVNQETGEVLDL